MYVYIPFSSYITYLSSWINILWKRQVNWPTNFTNLILLHNRILKYTPIWLSLPLLMLLIRLLFVFLFDYWLFGLLWVYKNFPNFQM